MGKEKNSSLPSTQDNIDPPPSYKSVMAISSSSSSDSDSLSDSDTESISLQTLDVSSEAWPAHLRRSPPPEYPEDAAARVPTNTSSGLEKPIAVPATQPKMGSAFLRAYPPVLTNYNISKQDFLHFIDKLNRVAAKSPPLQVLGLAGSIVGFVPLQTTQIVGNSVSAAASLGQAAVSKGGTEILLRSANKEIFGPRGLKVEIAKIDALAKVAGIPVLNDDDKVDKTTRLLAPLENLGISGQERRLQSLEQWIAHLETQDIPEVESTNNPLTKMSSRASERERMKAEKRMLKGRRKAMKYQDHAKAQEYYESDLQKIERRIQKARDEGDARKLDRLLAKAEKRKQKASRRYERHMKRVGKHPEKDREEKGMRKVLWLIIRNIDADSGTGPDPYMPIAERSTVSELPA